MFHLALVPMTTPTLEELTSQNDTEIQDDSQASPSLKRTREGGDLTEWCKTESNEELDKWVASEKEGWKSMCGTGEEREEKPKKKRKTKSYMVAEGYYILIRNLENEAKEVACSLAEQMEDGLEGENKERVEAGLLPLEFQVLSGKQIRIYPTEEEAQEKNRLYRQGYRKKPEVVMKRIKNSKLPEVIEKRREYSAREDVKQKKRINSTVRRLGLRTLKETNPAIYKTVMGAATSKFASS